MTRRRKSSGSASAQCGGRGGIGGGIVKSDGEDAGVVAKGMDDRDVDKLMDDAERGANATLTIDLQTQEIHGPDGGTVKFEVDPFKKHCLLNGLDDIGLTMEKKASIDTYEAKLKQERAWA